MPRGQKLQQKSPRGVDKPGPARVRLWTIKGSKIVLRNGLPKHSILIDGLAGCANFDRSALGPYAWAIRPECVSRLLERLHGTSHLFAPLQWVQADALERWERARLRNIRTVENTDGRST